MEKRLNTLKTIAGLACFLFIIDLVAGIILLFITYKEGNHPGFSPAMDIIKSWIITFIVWKFADAVSDSISYLNKSKEARLAIDAQKEAEVLEHYTDQRN